LNNYVMHSIARMAELLRTQPGERGLITANGGYLTKHAFGVYSTEPPAQPFQHEDLQAQVDATYKRDVADSHEGQASVEGYSVMYGAKGPDKAFIACRLDDERRVWAINEEPDVLAAMVQEEFCGRDVTIAGNVASF
jgi:acetyl-CoA C-acetyltransferase